MLRIAGPVILAELGWMGMGIVDTIMVGPLGPAAIGAVGVGNSLHFALAIFGMGLFLGLDTLVSHAYGGGRLHEARRWLRRGAMLALILSPAFILMGLALRFAIPAMGFHAEVRPILTPYFAVLLWSTPALLFYAAFRRYLQGMHWVTPVMFALVSANLVNAAANWLLIYGHWGLPQLGATGSAWATLIARCYMAGVLFIAVLNRRLKPSGSQSPGHAVLSPRAEIRRLLELGLPASAQITLEVGVFAAASALAAKLNPIAAASHQIAVNLVAVSFMIPLGFASAAAVRVGHALGRDEPRRAAAAGWTAILLGTGFMALAGATFFLVPRALIGLFSHDVDVLTVASSLLVVGAIFQLSDGVQGVTTGALRGLGDTRTAMVANLASHWLVGLPVGYSLAFALGFGVIGLWIGLSIGLTIVAVVLLTVWAQRIRTITGH
jgi:MATE family multidrug resistance protein